MVEVDDAVELLVLVAEVVGAEVVEADEVAAEVDGEVAEVVGVEVVAPEEDAAVEWVVAPIVECDVVAEELVEPEELDPLDVREVLAIEKELPRDAEWLDDS